MKTNKNTPIRRHTRIVPVILLAGVSPALMADEVPITTLAPITVSAHGGSGIPYDQSGVSVTVLDPKELREEGVTNLGEALTRVPGVQVQPGGGSMQRGNVSPISIRGMSKGQYILPMMDGLRIYDNSDGCNLTPNMVSRTNMFDLGTLEVLRGSQGTLYGSGAIGGVIYMETPEGQGDPSFSIFNEFGSFNSYTGNVTAQGSQDALSYFFSATYETTDNDLERVDGSKPEDKNAGHYENWQEALRLDYRPDKDTHARITYRRSDGRYHNPGNWGEPHYKYRTNLVSAALEKRISHAFATELSGGYYGADYMFGRGTNRDLRNLQLNWRNEYRWCRHQATTAGLAFMHSEYTADDNGTSARNRQNNENTYSLFAEHRVTPFKGWENTFALRLDQSDVYDALYTLRAASSWSFNNDRTRLSGSISRGYKTPTAFERMNGQFTTGWETTYQGNPNLDCQTSWSADLGIEHEWIENHTIGVTVFWIRTEDAINPDYNTDPYTFYNAAGTDTCRGIELSLNGTWEDQWNTGYTLSLTLCDPKADNGEQLKNTARQVWGADIHTSPFEGFTTGIGLAAASGSTGWDGSRLDAYYTLRWYASYKVNEHLTLHMRVENLTNQKFVSNPDDYGIYSHSWLNPGTAVYAGCTITF